MKPPIHTTEFTAAHGHGLRGPLGAISSAVEVLRQLSARVEIKDPRDAALMAHAQAVIARQTEQLTRMIDELLCAEEPEEPAPYDASRLHQAMQRLPQ